MIGKTNIQVRGTQYQTGPITVQGEDVTYYPADYGLDYFSSVSVPPNSVNFLEQYFSNTLTQVTSRELGPVTEIPVEFFANKTAITLVDLPSSVQVVKANAFAALTGLTTLRIDCPNLTSLSSYVFERCLPTNVYINAPNLATNAYLFSNNTALVSPTIEAIKVIDAFCFYNNTALREVTVPACCTSLTNNVFSLHSAVTTYAPLDITFLRHVVYRANTNEITTKGTEVGANILNNRDISTVRMFVPLDSLCGYRYYINRRNPTYLAGLYVFYDSEGANEQLPASVTQQYSSYLGGTYAITWYADKAMTTQVTAAQQAGRYYGKVTVTQEE